MNLSLVNIHAFQFFLGQLELFIELFIYDAELLFIGFGAQLDGNESRFYVLF